MLLHVHLLPSAPAPVAGKFPWTTQNIDRCLFSVQVLMPVCYSVCRQVMFDGVHADVIHSAQPQSVRNAAVDKFRSGATWLLIATDLVGRGMDFLGVQTVINYDFPQSTTDYIHRVGRTGRAGRSGAPSFQLKSVGLWSKTARSAIHTCKEDLQCTFSAHALQRCLDTPNTVSMLCCWIWQRFGLPPFPNSLLKRTIVYTHA